MSQADLHVHSKYSNHPSEWFLRELQASESYTEPEHIYRMAKQRGMDWVTITDHNAIEGVLLLKQQHPDDVFTGVELTASFPEDGCQVHVLVYGLDARQFDTADRLRGDLYQLRDYLVQENLPCSLAHALYSVNGKLTIAHLEKLLLLFNNFEGINGGRTRLDSETWLDALNHLTPNHIEELYSKHHLEPIGPRPWVKGITGGSDDHGGLFIGQTYTTANGNSIDEFLDSLRNRAGVPGGRTIDFKGLVFTVGKIAHHYAQHMGKATSHSLVTELANSLFEGRPLSWQTRMKLRTLRFAKARSRDELSLRLVALARRLDEVNDQPIDVRFDTLYEELSEVVDAWFRSLARNGAPMSFQSLLRTMRQAYATLPGLLVSVPFGVALLRMYEGRALINRVVERFALADSRQKRVMVFADTLDSVDGLRRTLKVAPSWLGQGPRLPEWPNRDGQSIRVVTSMPMRDAPTGQPEWLWILAPVCQIQVPYSDGGTLKIPSILQVLSKVCEFDPDEIQLHSPGPMGLAGLLAARLLKARSVGFSDAELIQALSRQGDESMNKVLQGYLSWFYSAVDQANRGHSPQPAPVMPAGRAAEFSLA